MNNNEIVDFGSLNEDGFWLEAYFIPSSLDFHLKANDTVRFSIEAIVDNFTPDSMQVLEVFWDGQWDERPEIMRERHHLYFKFVR